MKKMNKKEFDNIIRRNATMVEGQDAFGYVIDSEVYENYYSRDAFGEFIDKMSKEHSDSYEAYADGEGGELKEKKGRYGLMPPKMASVASSSRFCYKALSDCANVLGGDDVKFEYECKIEDIDAMTYPQLDAYIEGSNIFVEAKCHEIFDAHKINMSSKYARYIVEEFGIDLEEQLEEGRIVIELSKFGIMKETTRFDNKQLICHLIGIKSEMKRLGLKEATLVYLFFKPKTNDQFEKAQIEEIFNELYKEINIIFNSVPIRTFIEKNNIKLKVIIECSEVMEPLSNNNYFEHKFDI